MTFSKIDLLRALEEGGFYPVFQPLVELRTGQLAGFEMLARWSHKDRGVIAPEQFIPFVEKYGLMDHLSRTLVTTAFALPALTQSSLTLSINVSPLQLLGDKLADRVAGLAAQGGFPLDRLIVEVTESALLNDPARALDTARALKALNCKLALDDFGTGYSSLQHLHTLPFDELKVDRGFVGSMTLKRESRKIVASVIGLGLSLGLVTVAEGVETREQAGMLHWMGCDLAQGWLFGRPITAAELPALVAEARRNPLAVPPTSIDGGSLMSGDLLPSQRLAQLQAIYDGVPAGLCMLDRNMRYVSLNRQLAQLNGVPAAAHLGRTVAEVIPQVFPLVEPHIRRALQGQPVSGVEIEKPPPPGGGQGQTLMLSYQPARDEAGEILGVSVAIMDVSGARQAERALRESENHYRHMIQLSPHVPWVLDSAGEVTEASPRWESFTGQPLEEALGNGWLRMLHPDDMEPTREAIRVSLRTGDPIDIEYRVQRPGKGWKWMRSRGAPRFGPGGKVVCIYGVVEEVDVHKQVAEELQNCQAELRAAVNAAPIGMVLADAQDCTIYMVNPEAERIFRGAVFAGQKLTEYSRLGLSRTDGRELAFDEFPLSRTMLRGEPLGPRRMQYIYPDGTQARLELSSKPIYSDDGALIGGLMMVRDLSSQP
ncbi:MAG TPA: EAL domain-containing protein [Terracidiphilus sp.]|jgi:PAS domain S-box-containing protein|nr:EAL domain-containing protein [Terracidiphilus sp.]